MKVKSISQRISVALLCLMLLTSLLPARALAADEGSLGQSEPEGTALLADTADAVPYIDECGNLQTCANATVVTNSLTSWGASGSGEHWYVVNGDVPIGQRVTVTGDVHLILADGYTLTASQGINVTGGNSLTIYAQSAGDNMGVLTATGANLQAGIGGNNSQSGGAITINGGTVNATGGGAGAGIGGGFYSAGGNITINGGAVTANGGSDAAGIGGGGSGGAGGEITINGGAVMATGDGSAAGIGGGADYNSGGAGGNITITGGTVTAIGNGIGGGAGISGGAGAGGTFSTGNSGRAVIFASSISDQSSSGEWSGVIFQGSAGQVYGTNVTPTEDFTIPAGSTLTIDSGQTLTISEDITLTNNGTIVNNGIIDGTVSGNIVVDTYYLDTNNETQNKRANLVTTSSTTWTGNDADGGWYVVTGSVTIGQRVNVNGDVHLILADGCSLTVNGGINVTSGNSLTIYGQDKGTGELTANGENEAMSLSQAGIGGGQFQSGGTITINGGTVTATGSSDGMASGGAGIGGGSDGGAGGEITINGGTVDATGGDRAAGIGGGSDGAGGEITISGGTVTAKGGDPGGAGIGGGGSGAGGEITITGGTVNATGSGSQYTSGGAGIGGGSAGAGGIITISGGTVTANSGSGAGIGGGENGESGAFSTGDSGRAVIFASSISDQSNKENWSGVIFEDGAGKVYGTNVAPTEDFTIPDGDTLTIEDGRTLTISEGITFTNNGTIICYGTIDGDVGGNGNVLVDTYYLNTDHESVNVQASLVSAGSTTWTGSDPDGGWYVVQGEVDINSLVTVNGNVNLILADGCNLTVNGGINVNRNNSLTIYGQDEGTGALTANGDAEQAGIGSGVMGVAGTITINGGTVNAVGGAEAAGIGGGLLGDCGTVIINGGTVMAKGNSGYAGIGSNSGHAGGDIIISGGTVTAEGGIGGYSGTFFTRENGHAVIFASSIDNQSYKEDWSGVIFEGTTGQVYGTNVAPAEDFTIPDGDTLTIEDGKTLTIPEGITLTNNGTIIVESGGALVNKGTITGSGTIQLNGGSTVQTGNGPEMTLPGGGTIDPDTGAVTPGNGGSVVIGSGDNEITITPPAGESVLPNSDGSVTVPGGSIVTDSEGTKTTIPESGGTLRPDGSLSYSVTVTFDSQGGSEVASQTVTVGTAAARPDDPARSGYSFQGWYTAADGENAWDFADPVQTDMILYARWSQNSGGGSSGGSSGGGTTTYPPTIDAPENGSVATSPSRPKRGDTVTITAEPDDRYRVDQVTVTDRNGGEVEVTLGADGTYTFTQPAGKVEIEVTYAVDLPFTDVPEDAWYHEGVEHVYANYIMNGTSSSSFSPSIPVSRGMIMQILYNLAGQPDVEGSSGFTDVSGGYWGSDAIAWAVENGVAEGFGDGTFRPDDSLTREQMAVVLHNFAYRMGWDISASGDLSGFTDIPEGEYWARDALAWAYGEGLITGTSESTMEPNAQTSRAQIAVIMMRFCERYAETVE